MTTRHQKSVLGQVPGAVIYKGRKAKDSVDIDVLDYKNEHFQEAAVSSLEDTYSYKDSNSITWINLNGLNHVNSIETLGKYYELHPLVLEDIVNTTQRPKIDEYEKYLFVVTKMLYYNKADNIVSEQVSFVLGENYVLSFQEAEGDVFDEVRERIRQSKGRIRTMSTDYLLYSLIDAIIDHYFEIIEIHSEKIETLEESLFLGKVSDNTSKEIQDLKKEVLKVRRAIFPLREVISRIEKYEGKLIQKRTKTFFRDAYDHIIQVSENIDIYREMIWSLMDMYMTSISNKMNEVMKVLTIIATIFIPLTFIAGIYGMNFKNIPELEYQYGYYVLWAVMIVIFVVMLLYFKRKKWL